MTILITTPFHRLTTLIWYNTTIYSHRILATFLSNLTVIIDTNLTANSDRQISRWPKSSCLMYINLSFLQINSLYIIGLISSRSNLDPTLILYITRFFSPFLTNSCPNPLCKSLGSC